MEWILPLLIGVIAFSALIQLFWGYALSAIAKKTDQSGIMQILAWIPILQTAPLLAAGNASMLRCIVATVALIAGNLALMGVAMFLGDAFGNAIAALGFGLTALLAVIYFGRIGWNTAVNRDLPGWVGLLLFVPLVNLFVYPYIAFHDGWVGPNPVGLVIGVVLMLGSTAPYYQMVEMMRDGSFPTDLEEWTQSPQFAELGERGERGERDAMPTEVVETQAPSTPGDDTGPMPAEGAQNHEQSIRALLALQGRFEALESLATAENLLIQDHRVRAMRMVQAIRADLESRRDMIDPATYAELATHLVQIEANIHREPGTGSASARRTPHPGGALPAAPDPAAGDRPARHAAAPIRPFPVQPAEDCPFGTQLTSRSGGEKGDEEWCQQEEAYGGLRHGWYARYYAGGKPESMGEYSEGLRVGTWTRFYPNGAVRAQAQFERGLQHGWLLGFAEDGARKTAVRFDRGVAIR